jgi:hypothetical protein
MGIKGGGEKAGSVYFIPIVLDDSMLSHTLKSLLAIPLVVGRFIVFLILPSL